MRPGTPRETALFVALHAATHALWSPQWVASNGASWSDAGVEARKRMEAAGFDVAKGDTWAVNELSSAVRATAMICVSAPAIQVRPMF